MQTPWGKSDSIVNIQRGVSWVSTPSHGGLALTASAAVKTLSAKAFNMAVEMRYGTALVNVPKSAYLFFEEDCAYAIVFYEHPEWYRKIEALTAEEFRFAGDMNNALSHLNASQQSDVTIKSDMEPIIRQYFPEYFTPAATQTEALESIPEPKAPVTSGSFAAEVIADSSGKWTGNALRFATRAEAESYVSDLFGRWMAVREKRVVESTDPVNYRWVDGRLEAVAAETVTVEVQP